MDHDIKSSSLDSDFDVQIGKEHSFHCIKVIKIETYHEKELKLLSKQLSQKGSEYY